MIIIETMLISAVMASCTFLLIYDLVLDILRTFGKTDRRGPFTRFSDWLFDKMFLRFKKKGITDE